MDPATATLLATAAGTLVEKIFNKPKTPKGKNQQLSTQTPEQKEIDKLMAEYIKTGEGPLKDLFPKFNQQEFQQGVANPAVRKYQEDILPQLLEKYNAGNQALGSGQLRAEIRGQTDLQSGLDQLQYQAKSQSDKDRQNAVLEMLGLHQSGGKVENLYTQPGAAAPSTAQGIVSGLANNADKFGKMYMDYKGSQQPAVTSTTQPGYAYNAGVNAATTPGM